MKQVYEMPDSGLFVAEWTLFDGKFSFLYKKDKETGFVSIYHSESGGWSELEDQDTVEQTLKNLKANLFVF